MKKYVFLFFVNLFSFSIFSQTLAHAEDAEKKETEEVEPSEHGEKKFTFNLFYSPVMSVPIGEVGKISNPKNFFGFDVLYRTKKTYHYLGYDILETALTSTNGYLLSDKFGSYVFLSRGLKGHKNEGHELSPLNVLSLGVEYFIENKYVDFIIFNEVGTEFFKNKEIGKNNFLSIGLILEGHIFKF